MKHRTLSLVVLMASLAATAGTISKTYNFSSSQVEVNSVSTDNGSRSMVTYNGLDNTTDIGAPSIPVKSVLFKVPDNAINISVSAQTSGAISISLPDSIYYVPAVTTSGGVAVGAAIQKTASDYTPMVVEGKTWWQSTERWPDRYKREHYYYYEVGFTIGSKVEIDGVTWNKLYISHYRDGVNYIDGIKWNEDESLLGYIREEDGKVLTLMGSLAEKKERYASLFGETYAILCPMYPVDGKETLIYDFNKRDFHIGSLGYESNPSDYDLEPFLLKYVSEDLVNNSGRDYKKYTYTHEEGYAAEGEEIYFIEGIGMAQSCGWIGECLFFYPMIDREFTALDVLKLRYVTDKDYNILYEQEGGVKLWDEMAGVSNVAVDGSYDSEPSWYNMQGVKVAEPTSPGIYIRKAGNNTAKVVVK